MGIRQASTSLNRESMIEVAFVRVFGTENVELSNGRLSVFVDNQDDRELANFLASTMYLTPPRDEIASENFLRFVEVSSETEEDDSDEWGLEADEIGIEEEEDEEVDGVEEELNAIDTDGRALRILTTPDSHKFAAKIFHHMLKNDDLSRYPAFLMDLDRFLAVYKNKNPSNPEVDVASAMVFFETAKEKSARSKFLSAIMGLISDKLIAAYSSGNAEAFADEMGSMVSSMLENLPEPSKE